MRIVLKLGTSTLTHPTGNLNIRRVEELIRCPVALVSTSPEREDTILVRDPFAN